MRVVRSANELSEQINLAKSESKKAFGKDEVFIEKFLENAAHIEVQILGDKHGNIVHLYERDCSLQRRHQKIIERAPAHFLEGNSREEICASAVKIAMHVNYCGAGTIEFLYDKKNNPWSISRLECYNGLIVELFIFNDSYIKYKDFLINDNIIYMGGFSYMQENNFSMLGISGGLSFGDFTYTFEADQAENWIEGNTSLALYDEIVWEIIQGIHLMGKYDYFDPKTDWQTGSISRYTFGAEIYPLNIMEIKLQLRMNQIDLENAVTPDPEYLIQTHFWF